jgi:CubicO group peptidase (beta-lactamase class C family)
MLLGGGTFDGVPILSADTVADAFANHIGALEVPERVATASPVHSCDFVFGRNRKWGWGLLINTEDQPGARRAGSGAWAGLANTHFWVDPASGVTGSIYSQYLPFVTPGYLQMYAEFEKGVYAVI